MSYKGKVRNGVVVFSGRRKLPEGTLVVVQPVKKNAPVRSRKKSETLSEKLLKLAGSAGPGLPTDLALNHDHYLYGTRKK